MIARAVMLLRSRPDVLQAVRPVSSFSFVVCFCPGFPCSLSFSLPVSCSFYFLSPFGSVISQLVSLSTHPRAFIDRRFPYLSPWLSISFAFLFISYGISMCLLTSFKTRDSCSMRWCGYWASRHDASLWWGTTIRYKHNSKTKTFFLALLFSVCGSFTSSPAHSVLSNPGICAFCALFFFFYSSLVSSFTSHIYTCTQSIYSFRGASLHNFALFRRDFDPLVVRLELNYRCTRHILNVARLLVLENRERQGKALQTAKLGKRVRAVLDAL